MSIQRPFVLSIAGFDPSSGAGISADLKTFEMNHTYGLGVCTSITFQNDNEFDGIEWTSFSSLQKQIDVLFRKYTIDVIKIGLIADLIILNNIIDYLLSHKPSLKIIWDPVLKATAGFDFHQRVDFDLLRKILKKIFLLTPNIPEVIRLGACSNDPSASAIQLSKYTNVYLKGGHSNSNNVDDWLFTNSGYHKIEGERITSGDKHGSGCVLSAAIAANLAKGMSLKESCSNARLYIHQFLQSTNTLLGYHNILSEQ